MKKNIRIISVLILCLSFISCTTTEPPAGNEFGGHVYYSNGGAIARVRLSDETVEQLMNNASQVDVMANGNIVAVEAPEGRIITTDITGVNRTTLVMWTGTGYGKYFNAPRISYDQKHVSYDGFGYNPVTYVVNALTGTLEATIGDYNNVDEHYYAPSWAPDGSLFVQGGRQGNNNGIYKVDKDFTFITRIDPNLTNVYSPSVSPDGTAIAFLRDGELWTMGIDGANAAQLKTSLVDVRSPTWSPDSKYIAIKSQGIMYIVNPNELTITKINKAFPDVEQLSWK